MKELQAGIRLVQTKSIQLNQHRAPRKKALKPVPVKPLPQEVNGHKKLLAPFPMRSPVEVLRKRTTEGLRCLESQVERINQLSTELEAAVLEFKVIASEVNPHWRAIQTAQQSSDRADICKYYKVTVPQVGRKPDGSFLLLSKPVDLFQAEREAKLLAQTLRQRSKMRSKKAASASSSAFVS